MNSLPYTDDTFFHLGPLAQAGLLTISVLLACATLYLVIRITRNLPWYFGLLLAALVFWAFEWVSPQVYYLYYWVIFDSLPMQWVIGWPPPLKETIQLVFFSGEDTISAHSRAALFWLLVLSVPGLKLYPKRP